MENKLKKLTIIGGLVVALVIAATINFYPQKVDQSRGQRFQGKMFEKLNLTDEQKDKIEQLGIEHQKAMIDLRADMLKKRLAMKELMNKGNYSRSDFLNMVNDINAARDKIATARANHRMDVYELLNDQQKKIFNDHPMMMGGQRGEGRGMFDGPSPMGRDRGGRHQKCLQ
jgi:Spy/CpxP family protein refolding chaperone